MVGTMAAEEEIEPNISVASWIIQLESITSVNIPMGKLKTSKHKQPSFEQSHRQKIKRSPEVLYILAFSST